MDNPDLLLIKYSEILKNVAEARDKLKNELMESLGKEKK